MSTKLSLTPINIDGSLSGYNGALPEVANHILSATAALYAAVGFEAPWIGYLAFADGTAVGTCGFKAPPERGRVEIAYFTFPDFEGQGLASAMAAELISIAKSTDNTITIAAQTLPERNASHRILEKLGFSHAETVEHPEDGTVWEWRLIE